MRLRTINVFNSDWKWPRLSQCDLFSASHNCPSGLYLLISACKRGSPQYNTGTSQNEDEPIHNCQTAASCTSNFECTTIGSMQMCCPTVASICSNTGGRPIDAIRNTNFDPGMSMKRSFSLSFSTSSRFAVFLKAIPPFKVLIHIFRYYYDAEQGRCIAFTYNGALGNFNNFKSAADCDLFCAKLQCKYGTPLKIGAANQRCSTNADCPSTHECQSDHNVCCPRPRKSFLLSLGFLSFFHTCSSNPW